MIKRTLSHEVRLTSDDVDEALRRAAAIKFMEEGDMMGAFDVLNRSDVVIDLADGELGVELVGAYVTFDEEVDTEEPEEEFVFFEVRQ